METDLKVTVASEIALPVRDVQLDHLKTLSGLPVIVRCEAVDESATASLLGLPGVVDARGVKNDDERGVRYLLEIGPPLIHVATALRGDQEGKWIRPAFHADDAHAVPGSIPWRMLRFADKALVVNAILECSGYGGAAEAAFHDAHGARRSGGHGAGGAGVGGGAHPPGVAPGS